MRSTAELQVGVNLRVRDSGRSVAPSPASIYSLEGLTAPCQPCGQLHLVVAADPRSTPHHDEATDGDGLGGFGRRIGALREAEEVARVCGEPWASAQLRRGAGGSKKCRRIAPRASVPCRA